MTIILPYLQTRFPKSIPNKICWDCAVYEIGPKLKILLGRKLFYERACHSHTQSPRQSRV